MITENNTVICSQDVTFQEKPPKNCKDPSEIGWIGVSMACVYNLFKWPSSVILNVTLLKTGSKVSTIKLLHCQKI